MQEPAAFDWYPAGFPIGYRLDSPEAGRRLAGGGPTDPSRKEAATKTCSIVTFAAVLSCVILCPPADTTGQAKPAKNNPWVVYDGFAGPGKGKHIVLVSGDEEYRSEEALPHTSRRQCRMSSGG